uniref:Uncharacterized protein n=1 Tax=Rhizophora mucronata TaxID=61149 RepID=A0A2P2P9R3_RHIMU
MNCLQVTCHETSRLTKLVYYLVLFFSFSLS